MMRWVVGSSLRFLVVAVAVAAAMVLLGPVHPGPPDPGRGVLPPGELVGHLARLPDVALEILNEPVVGDLPRLSLLEDDVADHTSLDSEDRRGPVGDRELDPVLVVGRRGRPRPLIITVEPASTTTTRARASGRTTNLLTPPQSGYGSPTRMRHR
jgi:hypothetical protein